MFYDSCSFTGHRILSDDYDIISKKVYTVVRSLIANGTTTFISGGAIGFDSLCSKIVISMKKKFPEIKLKLILPCRDQDKKWNESQKNEYHYIIDNADEISYVSDTYITGCMHLRNRQMIDSSTHVITYCKRRFGGTYYTINYAKKKDKNIIDIINSIN